MLEVEDVLWEARGLAEILPGLCRGMRNWVRVSGQLLPRRRQPLHFLDPVQDNGDLRRPGVGIDFDHDKVRAIS